MRQGGLPAGRQYTWEIFLEQFPEEAVLLDRDADMSQWSDVHVKVDAYGILTIWDHALGHAWYEFVMDPVPRWRSREQFLSEQAQRLFADVHVTHSMSHGDVES